MIDSYAWPGGRETLLRFGPAGGPTAVFAPALFEEANRTRALTVGIARALADRGLAAAIPDLPGQNDSPVATRDARLSDWCAAYAAACAVCERPVAASLRGGALVDGAAEVAARWRFAPADGASLLRDLIRARTLAAAEAGERFDPADLTPPGEPVELAGNLLSRDLIADLAGTMPSMAGPIRTVRLDGDPRPADATLPGRPLWRRSEPDTDPALAAALASDLADWIARCGG